MITCESSIWRQLSGLKMIGYYSSNERRAAEIVQSSNSIINLLMLSTKNTRLLIHQSL